MLARFGDANAEVVLGSMGGGGGFAVVGWRGRRGGWEWGDGTVKGGEGVEGVDAGFGG